MLKGLIGRHWRPRTTIDVDDEVDLREWAKRLRVTPAELRAIVAEIGDRAARVATELGVPIQNVMPARAHHRPF
jgi:hypothetical protein